MAGRLADIWRHPIKAHGRERLSSVKLRAGETLPWDRAWAVVRAGADADGRSWASCGHFTRAATTPTLQAIEARLDEARSEITLTHPDASPLCFRPDTDAGQAAFLSWVNALTADSGTVASRLVRALRQGMTDTEFPSVSLINAASHRAVAQRLGRELSPARWRGNLLLDGLAPWEEFEWPGHRLRIGEAILRVAERIGRCQATSVDPGTGRRDTDMLRLLQGGWGHTDFGVYAVVEQAGRIAPGDRVERL